MGELVFEFSDPIQYLHEVLTRKRVKNPAFSLRRWSQQMGMRNPSLLTAVLRRERKLKPALANQIASTLNFNDEQSRYFHALVFHSNARTVPEKILTTEAISKLKKKTGFVDLELEQFRFIAGWHHLAILEMFRLKGFRAQPAWIAKRLGNITVSAVREALLRLQRLGLVGRDEKRQVVRVEKSPKIGDKVPSEAVKEFHTQMIQQSLAALREQSIEERDFRASTFAIRKENLPKMIRAIRNLHAQVYDFAAEEADDVYQFDTQLFKLTMGRETK